MKLYLCTISTILWVHRKLPQSTVRQVLPSNESYESKTGCNRHMYMLFPGRNYIRPAPPRPSPHFWLESFFFFVRGIWVAVYLISPPPLFFAPPPPLEGYFQGRGGCIKFGPVLFDLLWRPFMEAFFGHLVLIVRAH